MASCFKLNTILPAFTISLISAHAWYSLTGRVSWESNKDVFIVKIVFVGQEVINIYI